MFILLLRSFLTGLELNLQRHMLLQKKNISITVNLSCDFEISKGMSHNLALSRFQKMYGLLLGYSDSRADGPEGWLIP